MKATQIRKLGMCLVVQNYLTNTPNSILDSMPNFTAYRDEFYTKVDLLNDEYGLQQLERGGFTVNKKTLKLLLVEQAINVAAKIEAYAVNALDFVLADEVRYSQSYLKKITDVNCKVCCELIYDKGLVLLPDMGPYGLTQGMLDNLKNAIVMFGTSIPIPKSQSNAKKIATDEIATLFVAITELLHKMDVMVRILNDSNPDFVKEYFVSRRMVKAAYRTLSAKLRVVDVNGDGLEKVLIECAEIGLRRRTTTRGNTYLRNMPDGVYILTFSKSGYVTETSEAYFLKGERTELTVELKVVN